MELQGVRREYVRQKLYKVFRIKDEEYIITLKLLALYKWKYPECGNDVYQELTQLRAANRQHSNKQTIDFLYEKAQDALYTRNHRYAPTPCRPPDYEVTSIMGWKVA